jgi:ribosomal protein S18 acetylase RimI-like enzyme
MQLQRSCYCYDPPPDWNGDLSGELSRLSSARSFVYARIPCDQVVLSVALQKAGFRIVDVNLTFVKPIGTPAPRATEIRDAVAEDEQAVTEIAGSAYRFSRFHLDPGFETHEADALKREWARNFFRGKRGDRLFVAVLDGTIAGFLLAMKHANACVIDLIAVSTNFQRKGVGTTLIAGCKRAFADAAVISAGTQAANVASVQLYERLGFRLQASQFILHLHS